MKWKTLAVGVACLLASACVPPPAGPSHNFVVSYVAPTTDSIVPGPFTSVQGTITNTGPNPADYTIQLVASSGESVTALASNVLAGQTAIWVQRFLGDVTVSEAGVMSSPKPGLEPVSAVAVITAQEPDDLGLSTIVKGTVTNTGTHTGSFTVELQANTGQVGGHSAYLLPPGQTETWTSTFSGTVTVRIVRIGAPVLLF